MHPPLQVPALPAKVAPWTLFQFPITASAIFNGPPVFIGRRAPEAVLAVVPAGGGPRTGWGLGVPAVSGQERRAVGSARAKQRGVEHEDRDDLIGAGVGRDQGGVVGQTKVTAKPEHGSRHGP